MVEASEQLEHRTCRECGIEQPLSEYRRRQPGSDQRQHQCRTCHNAAMRRRRAQQRMRAFGQFADRAIKLKSQDSLNVLCEGVLRAFGGPGGFSSDWYQMIDDAQETRHGHPFVAKSMLAILKLVIANNKVAAGQRRPEVDGVDTADNLVTDEDIDAQLDRAYREGGLIRPRPGGDSA